MCLKDGAEHDQVKHYIGRSQWPTFKKPAGARPGLDSRAACEKRDKWAGMLTYLKMHITLAKKDRGSEQRERSSGPGRSA